MNDVAAEQSPGISPLQMTYLGMGEIQFKENVLP